MAELRFKLLARVIALPAMMLFIAGCATPVLDKARRDYYNNDPKAGIEELKNAEVPERDAILLLMERGTLYQLAGDFKSSQIDYNEADSLLKKRDTLSVSRGTSSMVINDNMLNFYGYPFERTYLHVMCALSYLAVGDWQGAGVESRRIINSLKKDELKDFPEDAFSRYISGLCLELAGDVANAKVEYRKASRISKLVDVTEQGLIVPQGSIDPEHPEKNKLPQLKPGQTYITCIILLGRVADYSSGIPNKSLTYPVVEISSNGKHLGNAVTLADLSYLAAKSESLLALKKAAKTGTRVVAKTIVADELAQQNSTLGALAYLALFMTEQPDFRHWETLPRYICAGRFPAPANLKSLDLTLKHGSASRRPLKLTNPIVRNGLLMVNFERGF